MRVLISGFDSFPGFDVNPSRRLVETLALEPLAGGLAAGLSFRLLHCILPVRFREAPRLLLEQVRATQPDVVLSFGVAGGATRLRVEKIAINWEQSSVPDVSGELAPGRVIRKDGPDGLFSTLPVAALVAAGAGVGAGAELSYSAGAYLCNHLMYELLWAGQGMAHPPRSGFIHIPPAAEWNTGGSRDAVPFEDIRSCASAMLRAMVSLPA